jgi:hypothetical protein
MAGFILLSFFSIRSLKGESYVLFISAVNKVYHVLIHLSDVSIYNKDRFVVRSKPYKPEAANAILGVFESKRKGQPDTCWASEHHYHHYPVIGTPVDTQ